jgi:serine phosphatase RsbU (regulator of sigma subunit)
MIYHYKSEEAKDTGDANGSRRLAVENYQRALDVFIETAYKKGIATVYNNIGVIYAGLGNTAIKHGNKMEAFQSYFPKALVNYEQAFKIKQEINDRNSYAGSYMNLASVYKDMWKFNESRAYFNNALSLAKELGSKEDIRDSYFGLAELDSITGNFNGAFNNYKLYVMYRDSVHNDENTNEMLKSQMNFDFEKKQAIEKAEQEKKEALHKAELSKQRTQRNALFAGVGLLMLLAIVSYRSFLNKKKSHAELELKNKIIEEKNKDITDSINYAKQIQQAILPTTGALWTAFKDHFVLYKPKDIVSGDFYWFTEKQDKHFLAVVDCTGHGVPGAFMSMMSSATLNHIVNDKGVYESNKILDMMHTAIRVALNQEGGQNRDGMDIGLCVLDKKNRKLFYSGAMRSLYMVRNGELDIVKGDRRSIGGVTSEGLQPFTCHEIDLVESNMFYLTSDGYVDQFGGAEGKKFREKQFHELLRKIYEKPMKEQKAILESEFVSWKGPLEQVDDVCVVGVRV